MDYQNRTIGYLFCLLNHPKIDKSLSKAARTVLYQFTEGAETKYSMSSSLRSRYYFGTETADIEEEKVSSAQNRTKNVKEGGVTTLDSNETPGLHIKNRYLTRVSVGNLNIRNKIFHRLEKLKLIECINDEEKERIKYLNQKQRFRFNRASTKPYRITEYGLFYIFSNLHEFPDCGPLLSRYYRKSIVVRTLISRYFDKKTIEHHTPWLHALLLIFLSERCQITSNAIAEIEANSTDAKKQEFYRRKLGEDLDWQARSFALRLLTSFSLSSSAALSSTSGRKKSKSIYDLPSLTESDMDILKNDKKFSNLLSIALQDVNKGYDKFMPHKFGNNKRPQ